MLPRLIVPWARVNEGWLGWKRHLGDGSSVDEWLIKSEEMLRSSIVVVLLEVRNWF